MFSYFHNANSSSGSGYFNSLDPFSHGVSRGGSQALVLDNEKGELVKAPVSKVGKKEPSEAKTLAALKSHSEAERRRRERINAHLATLRGLVPCTEKMDKATLLAEVVNQVKELKKNAIEASKGLLIPMDNDEVVVEPLKNRTGDGTLSFKVSICCDYRPEILSEIRQSIDALKLNMVNAEISTLEGRLKNILFLTSCRNKNVVDNSDAQNQLANSIRKSLDSVLEKCSLAPVYSPRTTLQSKRRKLTFFDSPSSTTS